MPAGGLRERINEGCLDLLASFILVLNTVTVNTDSEIRRVINKSHERILIAGKNAMEETCYVSGGTADGAKELSVQ